MYTPIGAHQPLKKLATGGMADVFLATDAKQSNGYCALKVLLPEVMNRPLVREHFEVEARLLESLDHPSIVRFVEYGSSNARPFFAMEYLHGVSGSELLVNAHKLKRPIPLGLAIGITKCIADALHYGSELRVKAGGKAIIHNDVSPHNFQLDFDGQIKLLDYGVALTGAGTNDSLRRGKFAYMSPEAIRKDTLDHRSDLFSLGVSLYELVTMRRAFRGDSPEISMKRILEGNLVRPTELTAHFPLELERIILKCLEPNPELRYHSGQALSEDLARFANSCQLDLSQKSQSQRLSDLFAELISRKERELDALRKRQENSEEHQKDLENHSSPTLDNLDTIPDTSNQFESLPYSGESDLPTHEIVYMTLPVWPLKIALYTILAISFSLAIF